MCSAEQLAELSQQCGVEKMSIRASRKCRLKDQYKGHADVNELSIQGWLSLHVRAKRAVFEKMVANRTDQVFQAGRRTPQQLLSDRRVESQTATLRKEAAAASLQATAAATSLQATPVAAAAAAAAAATALIEQQQQQSFQQPVSWQQEPSWPQEQHRQLGQKRQWEPVSWQQEASRQQEQHRQHDLKRQWDESWQQHPWQGKECWQNEQYLQQVQGWEILQTQQNLQSWMDLKMEPPSEASSSSGAANPCQVPAVLKHVDWWTSTPAAATAAVQPPGMPSTWKCGPCTHLNSNLLTECELCTKSRGAPPEPPPGLPFHQRLSSHNAETAAVHFLSASQAKANSSRPVSLGPAWKMPPPPQAPPTVAPPTTTSRPAAGGTTLSMPPGMPSLGPPPAAGTGSGELALPVPCQPASLPKQRTLVPTQPMYPPPGITAVHGSFRPPPPAKAEPPAAQPPPAAGRKPPPDVPPAGITDAKSLWATQFGSRVFGPPKDKAGPPVQAIASSAEAPHVKAPPPATVAALSQAVAHAAADEDVSVHDDICGTIWEDLKKAGAVKANKPAPAKRVRSPPRRPISAGSSSSRTPTLPAGLPLTSTPATEQTDLDELLETKTFGGN